VSEPLPSHVRGGDSPRLSLASEHQYLMLEWVHNEPQLRSYSEANANGIRYFRNPVKAVSMPPRRRLWLYVSEPSDDNHCATWQLGLFLSCSNALGGMPKPLLGAHPVPIKSVQDPTLERC